ASCARAWERRDAHSRSNTIRSMSRRMRWRPRFAPPPHRETIPSMTLAILQLVLATAACFALWRLWSSLFGRGVMPAIIAAGFLIRAFAGQVLFWLSWVPLPIGRSLQAGDGFWFFAIDAPFYMDFAK